MTKLEFTPSDFRTLCDCDCTTEQHEDVCAASYATKHANARLAVMLGERGAGIFLKPVAMGSPALIEADGRFDATHSGIVVNVEALSAHKD